MCLYTQTNRFSYVVMSRRRNDLRICRITRRSHLTVYRYQNIGIFQAVMRIKNVTSSDSGTKRCVAENIVGRSGATWTLLVNCKLISYE